MHDSMKIAQQASGVDSEKFSGRNLSIGCCLAWVTIARDSESDYPFNPVGQFRRICAGHLDVRLAQLQQSSAYVLAVVVTVQVQLLVPEFTVTHLLPYLFIIPRFGQ